jgi:hypothetical protein
MEGLKGEDISPLNSLASVGGLWKSPGQRGPDHGGIHCAIRRGNHNGSAVVFFTSSMTA